ncbi:deaminase [Roseiterribacter gracilis]
MTALAEAKTNKKVAAAPSDDAQTALNKNLSKEFFFAIVGAVGAGSSFVSKALLGALDDAGITEVFPIKASDAIKRWATESAREIPPARAGDIKTIEDVVMMQNLGDEMRSSSPDFASVAMGIVKEIRRARAEDLGVDPNTDDPIDPGQKRRVFVIDSLRHPSEVYALRRLYGAAFALIGVVTDEDTREERLANKYFVGPARKRPESKGAIKTLMDRDEKDKVHKYGQHVQGAFELADFYLDNSNDGAEGNKDEHIGGALRRLVGIVFARDVAPPRPTIAETAMYQAHAAKLRSACMSRQVGASLVDDEGNLVSTGTNEVPKSGGGVYGQAFEQTVDHRCMYRPGAVCSNNVGQNDIIAEVIDGIPDILLGLEALAKQRGEPFDKAAAIKTLQSEMRRSRIGGLLEFSRSVHAEMDALLAAGRTGATTAGTRLFVTTFPCHYCARHIVAAGVKEVQFIEPYPKSKALSLHRDAIKTSADLAAHARLAKEHAGQVVEAQLKGTGKVAAPPPEPLDDPKAPKVLFRPFVGVGPRMYARAFFKDRELKDGYSGVLDLATQPPWGSAWQKSQVSYAKDEAAMVGGLATP